MHTPILSLTNAHTHTWKVTVNKRSIYHHCHKSDAGRGSSIWLRPILAQEGEISCLFLLSMLPIWFPITSNSNQQQRRGDLRETAAAGRKRGSEGGKEGQRSKKDGGGARDAARKRQRERKKIRSPSFCEHHPPVSYTGFLSQPLQTP